MGKWGQRKKERMGKEERNLKRKRIGRGGKKKKYGCRALNRNKRKGKSCLRRTGETRKHKTDTWGCDTRKRSCGERNNSNKGNEGGKKEFSNCEKGLLERRGSNERKNWEKIVWRRVKICKGGEKKDDARRDQNPIKKNKNALVREYKRSC